MLEQLDVGCYERGMGMNEMDWGPLGSGVVLLGHTPKSGIGRRHEKPPVQLRRGGVHRTGTLSMATD